MDTTAAGIRGAQEQFRELQKPGPSAPFQFTPLTSLSDNPFAGRPGPTPAEDKQVTSVIYTGLQTASTSSASSTSKGADDVTSE